MRLPASCYRLQFRDGMDFDRAAELVPYLDRLGITDLYASPLFTAASGSGHGYDVTDPTSIDPAIGGRDGLERLSERLRAHDMGLVLDIVPNHMAFSAETPWLRDLLRHGADSRFSRHFDLDPAAERLRLPWLDDAFETLADARAFRVEDDPDGPVLVRDGLRVPLARTSALARAAESPDPDAIRALHAEQPWRLVDWRTEQDALGHRRFFNITSLIGVRVEDETVFEDAHALLFDLVDAGIVTGIRIDHIDGLADPAGYLDRLHARVPDTPVWVEKILTGNEALPDWPVQGTTGYVAARAMGRALTDPEGRTRLDAAYRRITGRRTPLDRALARAKRQIMTQDLSAELWQLHGMLSEMAAADPVASEYGPEMLRRALVELIAVFPRYRSYMTADEVGPEDAALIRDTAARAAEALPSPGALPFLADALLAEGHLAGRLRLRFQQVTGAAMAKAQEDTLFYRDVSLLGANEVGGEPDDSPLDPGAFHDAMRRRAETMPHGLTLTSSHDTKRSEDARMRITAATHHPEAFLELFETCSAGAGEDVLPELRWYMTQTLLAVAASDGDLSARLRDHVEKALREAKEQTFWIAPDDSVECPARAYADRLADRFDPLPTEAAPMLEIADRLSLMLTALKLTVPGIPDIYQGCEAARYMLTDPDNRRPVDFAQLEAALDDPNALPRPLDRAKFALTRLLLGRRRDDPGLFLHGDYRPLDAPPNVIAFERRAGERWLRVALCAGEKPPDPGGERLWPVDGSGGPVIVTASTG